MSLNPDEWKYVSNLYSIEISQFSLSLNTNAIVKFMTRPLEQFW